MSQKLESLGFSLDGARNRTEVYSLLSEARIKYALAQKATALAYPLDDPGVDAGHEIFISAYYSLADQKKTDLAELLFALSKMKTIDLHEAILPYPILLALAFFLDSEQTVCLHSWHFHTGKPDVDRAIVAWPNSILWGLPAKMKFFHDLFTAYEGVPPEHPILSNNRTRAVQLLAVGQELIKRQLIKIGKPPSGKILLSA